MLEKCRGIVFNTVNYSENSVVLRCYTDKFGLQAYMVSGVKGKKASIKPSHLMPLSLLDLEVYHQQNKGLQRIKELKCTPVLNHLHFDLTRSTISLFVSELLSRCIREEDQYDERLFEFIYHAIQVLDLSEGPLLNFPVFFMLQLSKHLGFFPKNNYSDEHPAFSLNDGEFVAKEFNRDDYCSGDQSRVLSQFLELDFETWQSLETTGQIRRELLHKVIRYYQLHRILQSDLRSPQVLHEVLHND